MVASRSVCKGVCWGYLEEANGGTTGRNRKVKKLKILGNVADPFGINGRRRRLFKSAAGGRVGMKAGVNGGGMAQSVDLSAGSYTVSQVSTAVR